MWREPELSGKEAGPLRQRFFPPDRSNVYCYGISYTIFVFVSMLKLCVDGESAMAPYSPEQQSWCIMGTQYLLVEKINACGVDTGDKGK